MAMVMLASMAAMISILKAHWDGIEQALVLNSELEAANATLLEREQALQRSEQRFLKVSESNPPPLAVSRLSDGRYLAVNPAWQREFGWSEADALGRTSVDLGFWEYARHRQQWVQELQSAGRTMNHNITAMARDGRKLELSLSAELIDYDGQTCVLAILMDQTERIRAENAIRELNEQLESRVEQRTTELGEALGTLRRAQDELVQSEKLASLGQLVAGVAHELNTPIGNALVTTTALGDAASSFDAQVRSGSVKRSSLDRFVAQVTEGATLAELSLHRASDLVRSFKQVAVDQASERKRRFDLADTVSEVADTLRPNFKGQPWQIEVDIPAAIEMDSYPGPLGQVIINLVMNTVLHAFEGRTEGNIRIRACRPSSTTVTLSFSDDGVGIAPENLPRIFDPFFTTKLGQGGSGLGLSIVHRLVTQVLGGQLRVESTLGEGTQFTFELPLMSPDISVEDRPRTLHHVDR